MAVIRNTASMCLRGRVGNTTYYIEGGRQIARVSQNSSNYGETASRSETQQLQRAKWANLVNFYKVSKSWMKKAFESKTAKQSDYNRFMQLNTATARIYLTKNMYAAGGMVVDAFKVSEGSLRPINVEKSGAVYTTDLYLGSLSIDANTTIAAFSEALVNNNSHVTYGMQISFISYQQETSSQGVPSCICTAYEVTLDSSSSHKLRDYLPLFCSSVVSGCLGTNNDISAGAFVYILSDSTSGKTLVSSQSLISNNALNVSLYSSKSAKAASIASYGVDQDVFLMSGSSMVSEAAQPVSIVGLKKGNDIIAVGSYAIPAGDMFATAPYGIVLVAGSFTACTSASIKCYNDNEVRNAISILIVDDGVELQFQGGSWYNNYMEKISITLDGKVYTADFNKNQESE